jgi:hypothetical protein
VLLHIKKKKEESKVVPKHKIRQNYLWRGRKEAKGGLCLVAWARITKPKEMGGWALLI